MIKNNLEFVEDKEVREALEKLNKLLAEGNIHGYFNLVSVPEFYEQDGQKMSGSVMSLQADPNLVKEMFFGLGNNADLEPLCRSIIEGMLAGLAKRGSDLVQPHKPRPKPEKEGKIITGMFNTEPGEA